MNQFGVVFDVMNKQANCGSMSVAQNPQALLDFQAMAKIYGKPVLEASGSYAFISDGWLFVYFPAK